MRWTGPDPSDDEKQQAVDEFANAIAKEITVLAGRRIQTERSKAWREAYSQAGSGSTFIRARILADDVYDRAAPVPSVTPSPDQNQFLHEVTHVVNEVANQLAIEFL